MGAILSLKVEGQFANFKLGDAKITVSHFYIYPMSPQNLQHLNRAYCKKFTCRHVDNETK